MNHKECTPWVKRLQINNVELLKKNRIAMEVTRLVPEKQEKVVENLIRTQNWR